MSHTPSHRHPHPSTPNVEASTGTVAEVVAMYGRTAIDVAHVGQHRSKRKSGTTLLGFGGLLLAGGLGLFAYEASQDWEAYAAQAREAAEMDLPAPAVPGLGTGALGLALAMLGLIPSIMGAMRLRERPSLEYAIGESEQARLQVDGSGLPDPAAFPLVQAQGADGRDGQVLHFTPYMEGRVTREGKEMSLDELIKSGHATRLGSAYAVPLPFGSTARVAYKGLTFHVRATRPGLASANRGEVDKTLLAHVGGVAVVALGFFGLMSSIPDDALAFALDEQTGENRFVGFMHQPDVPPPEEELIDDDVVAEAGGGEAGQRHAGEEGAAGNPKKRSKSGRMSVKGPRDAIPQMARNQSLTMQAERAGILGIMASTESHFLASPGGGPFAVGNEDADVWGNLTGTEIGEGYGVGGLGVVGNGHGGGGTGMGVMGLGNTGLIGKNAVDGKGTGYGPRGGKGTGFGGKEKKTIRVRSGSKIKLTGALDKSVIRRIIRGHINEVRACYNQGLVRNPNLSGRVAVQFLITNTGKVGSAAVNSSNLPDKKTEACIVKAVKRWKFPRPQGGGNVMVTYPFVLSN